MSKIIEDTIMGHEDRISELEKVALILRAKIEPETLTEEAIERAQTIARERDVPEEMKEAEA